MTVRARFAGEGSPSRANVDEVSLNGMIALPAMGNDQSCGGDESKKIKMEVRKKGEGEDHFKAKIREKISFLQPGTYGNEKWPFEGIQIRNLKGFRCQVGSADAGVRPAPLGPLWPSAFCQGSGGSRWPPCKWFWILFLG